MQNRKNTIIETEVFAFLTIKKRKKAALEIVNNLK